MIEQQFSDITSSPVARTDIPHKNSGKQRKIGVADRKMGRFQRWAGLDLR
jgi:hypothetical protein